MLVLSRKVGERISIGDDIQIKITHLTAGRVRIGIEAPRGIAIERSELQRSLDHAGSLAMPNLDSPLACAVPG